MEGKKINTGRKAVLAIAVIVILLFLISLWAFPKYNVWRKELRGKADLKEAEWSRQIAIEEAKARKESAVLDAEAEVERAKGVAEANQIIGNSLRDNEAYLRYLWIHGLHDGSSEVIYVPTEANLPILEATRAVQN
ncbi:hypothetical protein KY346_06040 [Candidatus Woesearchaeota archaeon]|nr:hypothetical protein [Candidatus Woesearchaeota archaeon]